MTQPLATKYALSNNKMRIFYKWLRSRKVFCVEGFVVMPDVLEDLAGEKLRENSLVKISLVGYNIDKRDEIVANLLIKHASSLQELNLSHIDGMELIMSTLTERHIRLRVLSVDMEYITSEIFSYLKSYLLSAGDLLEDLKVEFSPYDADDFVLLVSTSCPKLTRFHSPNACSAEHLCHLFEQCPYLQHVSIEGAMKTDEDINSVSIEVRGSNYDWVICLSHILKRRLYKQVTLRLYEDYYHPVGNLKSVLEPYQICLKASTSERALISLLQDLPHLNTLHLSLVINNQYADATLSAIADHMKSLTTLSVTPDFRDLLGLSNSDDEVSEDMLDQLLLDKKVQWPSTLEVGSVQSHGKTFSFEFNKEDRHFPNYYRISCNIPL
eukprot:scaffold3751_cov201-Ochromonas_danica.AAC.2